MTDGAGDTRQQRRAKERAKRRAAEALLRDGLPPVNDIAPAAALTRHLMDILADSRDAHRATRAARTAERVFEASIRRTPDSRPIACRKGCGYCCTNFVAATVPEVFVLAERVRERWRDAGAPVYRRLEAVGLNPSDIVTADRSTLTAPCPVLGEDNACSAYDGRPLACRGYASLDLNACISALTDVSVEIPNTKTRVLFRSRCSMALWAALKANRLPYLSYDLQHALAIAVPQADAEKRWLAGENVFSAVQTDVSRPPEFEVFVDRLIESALR